MEHLKGSVKVLWLMSMGRQVPEIILKSYDTPDLRPGANDIKLFADVSYEFS